MGQPSAGRAPLQLQEARPPDVGALTEEPPYHFFVLTGLGLAIGAGFVLAALSQGSRRSTA